MTASRDPDRLIRAFLMEGAEQLEDQIYDAVRAEIEHKRQRVVIGPWRMPAMSRFLTIGLSAAAVVLVLVVGSRLVGAPTANVGGPDVEPTATPSASVAATSASASPTRAAPGLPEGPFTIVDTGALNAPLRITVTIPAAGWYADSGVGALHKGDGGDPPEAALLGWSWQAGTEFYVYGDPCRWAATTPDTPATTVDQIVTALAAQASRDASAPEDVTVGGYVGKRITLHVPNDPEAIADCDEDTFASYGTGDTAKRPSRYHQGPGQVDELWVLDVNGVVAIIDVMYRPSTSAALVEEVRAIAESATFEAP